MPTIWHTYSRNWISGLEVRAETGARPRPAGGFEGIEFAAPLFLVTGLRERGRGLGLRVRGAGFRAAYGRGGVGFRAQGAGCGVRGLGVGGWGFGLRI